MLKLSAEIAPQMNLSLLYDVAPNFSKFLSRDTKF